MLTSSEATQNTLELMNTVGCNQSSTIDKINCLQKLEPNKILTKIGNSFERPIYDNFMFNKTIDELIRENLFKSCNIITGYTSDEMGFFVSRIFSPSDFKTLNSSTFITRLQQFLNSRYPYNKLNIDSILVEYFGTTQISTLNQSTINYPQTLLNILGDMVFVGQSFQMAEIYSQRGKNAYVYEYKYRIGS